MSRDAYPWIISGPVPAGWRPGPSRRTRRRGFVDAPCANCGYDPVGLRKTCPACLVLSERTDAV